MAISTDMKRCNSTLCYLQWRWSADRGVTPLSVICSENGVQIEVCDSTFCYLQWKWSADRGVWLHFLLFAVKMDRRQRCDSTFWYLQWKWSADRGVTPLSVIFSENGVQIEVWLHFVICSENGVQIDVWLHFLLFAVKMECRRQVTLVLCLLGVATAAWSSSREMAPAQAQALMNRWVNTSALCTRHGDITRFPPPISVGPYDNTVPWSQKVRTYDFTQWWKLKLWSWQ